jgi:hypothetical protein
LVEINGDGHLDILSGSYSRMERSMAGLFQVLYGSEDGFSAPAVLTGSDGEPLIIEADDEHMTDKICTRPTAVDLDGDGHLDIVSGNFTGTFVAFDGRGEGRFSPKHRMLLGADGRELSVPMHSDPFFVDWDGDGDLDLLSGSAQGGLFLFENQGDRTDPSFAVSVEIVKPNGHGYSASGEVVFGDAHIHGPQGATRVWVDDVDGDGKLDVLLGDMVSLSYPAEGLDEATCRKKLADWQVRMDALQKTLGDQPGDEAMEAFQESMSKLWEERESIVRQEMTGFVWLMLQK